MKPLFVSKQSFVWLRVATYKANLELNACSDQFINFPNCKLYCTTN